MKAYCLLVQAILPILEMEVMTKFGGAYHFDIKQPQNAPIFSTAVELCFKTSATTKGIKAKKQHVGLPNIQWLMLIAKSQ